MNRYCIIWLAPYIKDKLGKIKISQLNQTIIQGFFDEVDKKEKHIVNIIPVNDFFEKLKAVGYDYSKLRNMMRKSYGIIKKHPINHYTLRRALDGKNVSRTFGKNLSL